MAGRLAGRVAIVTGASRGLGRAIALAMGREGAAVAVVARTQQVWDERLPGTIGETVREIEAAGGRAIAIAADLLDAGDRARAVAETRAAFGPITVLVNNAAFTAPGRPPAPGTAPVARATPPAPAPSKATAGGAGGGQADWPGFATTPVKSYRRHFEMVFAAYDLAQMVIPDMLAAGGGTIINITSGASRMPGEGPYPARTEPTLPGYGGSKAALEHLTRCIGYELCERGIAVNALSPSRAIVTPGVSYYSAKFADVAPEEDFAEAAVRLALVSPGQVTGRVIGHDDVLNGSFASYTR